MHSWQMPASGPHVSLGTTVLEAHGMVGVGLGASLRQSFREGVSGTGNQKQLSPLEYEVELGKGSQGGE